MILKSAISFMITLVLVLVCMPKFISYMKKLSIKQSISEYSLEEDQKKAGTPIMGGILFILFPILVNKSFEYGCANNDFPDLIYLQSEKLVENLFFENARRDE